MLPRKQIMVAEVCVETYSKNDLKKKEEVEKRPQNININPTNKRGMLRERERERERASLILQNVM